MALKDIIKLARVGHWLKNAIILLPVIFARRIGDGGAWIDAFWTAIAFCLVSSGIYIVNDIADRKRDRLHPSKKDRPLAAGRVSMRSAVIEAFLLLAGGVLICLSREMMLLYVLVAYILLQLAYTFVLKRKIIIDVICIAIGFVLRAIAGAVAISVEPSVWLIVCTFTLCMFLGFCKRCNELATLGDSGQAENHRSTLGGYTSRLLTHLITLSASIAVVSFLMYSSSGHTAANLGTIYLVYTLPIVVYAIFRFAMLSMRGRFSDPMSIVLHDWPLQLTAIVWIAAVLLLIQWGPDLQMWMRTG